MTSPFQQRLQAHLQTSTLTPGIFPVSETFKTMAMAAVLVDGKPIVLTGSGDDAASLSQAQAFSQSKAFKAAMTGLSLTGPLSAAVVQGKDIDWPEQCEAVVGSASGVVETDAGNGDLKMISLHGYRGLTTLLCVNTELARIIDPKAPMMDDGRDLTELLKDLPQVLNFK